jgi:hypothetical protein
LTTDGERKARLKEARKARDGVGLKRAEMRGEKTGSSRLPNLSTRPPTFNRKRSTKNSSWTYAPNSVRFSPAGARLMSKLFWRRFPP